MTQLQLLDKIINVSLVRSDGYTAKIVCPPTGRKPTIRLSGEFYSRTDINRMELRVTNFVTDVPLSDYTAAVGGYTSISAGYSGNLGTAFYGEVVNAYQELPGPDGVTMFEFMNGYFSTWTTKLVRVRYEGGTSLRAALQDLANQLGLTLLYWADSSLVLPFNGIQHNGLAKDLITKLTRVYAANGVWGDWQGVTIRPDGQNLICTNKDLGTGLQYQLNYVSMLNHTGYGFEIQAPWVPSIRPDDFVIIDARYFRQTLGGAQVVPGELFKVVKVSFDFCTTDDTNMMTVTTVEQASLQVIHKMTGSPKVMQV